MTAIAYDTPSLADNEDLPPDQEVEDFPAGREPAGHKRPAGHRREAAIGTNAPPGNPASLGEQERPAIARSSPDIPSSATAAADASVSDISAPDSCVSGAASPDIIYPDTQPTSVRPTRHEAEEAVRTLIKWAGDTPEREGLVDTPRRVTDAYTEWFTGYQENPEAILARTFEEIEGYDDIVLLRGIRLESYCEHHMAPIIGVAHVAYLPSEKVVGISKLARLVDAFAKRLQVQEKLTAQIADTLDDVLAPKGVAVMIRAEHQCMSTRGVHKHGVDTVTTRYTGVFRDDSKMEERFLRLLAG